MLRTPSRLEAIHTRGPFHRGLFSRPTFVLCPLALKVWHLSLFRMPLVFFSCLFVAFLRGSTFAQNGRHGVAIDFARRVPRHTAILTAVGHLTSTRCDKDMNTFYTLPDRFLWVLIIFFQVSKSFEGFALPHHGLIHEGSSMTMHLLGEVTTKPTVALESVSVCPPASPSTLRCLAATAAYTTCLSRC